MSDSRLTIRINGVDCTPAELLGADLEELETVLKLPLLGERTLVTTVRGVHYIAYLSLRRGGAANITLGHIRDLPASQFLQLQNCIPIALPFLATSSAEAPAATSGPTSSSPAPATTAPSPPPSEENA